MLALHLAQALGLVILFFVVPALLLVWRRRNTVRGTGRGVVLTLLTIVAGLCLHLPPISALGALGLAAVLVGQVWRRALLRGLVYARTLERTHVFPGEKVRIAWEIANRSRLPLSYVHWQEPLPGARPNQNDGVDVTDINIRPVSTQDRAGEQSAPEWGINESLALAPGTSIWRTAAVRATRRGVYRFGPARLHGQDLLGLNATRRLIESEQELVVYPHVYPLEELDIPAHVFLASLDERSSLIDDPSWYRGVRDYTPQDPMKRIDWNVTARTQALHVRLFEPVARPKVTVIAYLHVFERTAEGGVQRYHEPVISTAASVIHRCVEAGAEVGLLTNGRSATREGLLEVPAARGMEQAGVVFDALARIHTIDSDGLSQLFSATSAAGWGEALVVCSNATPQELVELLADRAASSPIMLVLVGTRLAPTIPNVRVLHARPGGAKAA